MVILFQVLQRHFKPFNKPMALIGESGVLWTHVNVKGWIASRSPTPIIRIQFPNVFRGEGGREVYFSSLNRFLIISSGLKINFSFGQEQAVLLL